MQGIIFCVDVSDSLRIANARDELQALMDLKVVKDKRYPILVFANKTDLGAEANAGGGGGGGGGVVGTADNSNTNNTDDFAVKALTTDNVRVALGIENHNQYQRVKLFACSALTGAGVNEGFAWLHDMLKLQRRGQLGTAL